ncbi:hypothetical protein RSOL_543920, partial [Rhizoctonia solani AG-3 Rhs1AP]
MDKTLSPEDQWKEAVFRKHWAQFLAALLTATKGKDGGRVRVNTFNQWCTDLIWLVGRHLINEEGQHIGTKVLTEGKLYADFRNTAARLTIQFDLNRIPGPRLWIGQLELLLIYQSAIRKSEKYGRASALQTILATSLVFHIGARVGSLGWSHIRYLEEEKYMKCQDVRIERMDYGVWDAEVTVLNRKGWNKASDSARPITYRLSAVTKTHNLFFDTPSLLLLHLFHRESVEDAAADANPEGTEVVDKPEEPAPKTTKEGKKKGVRGDPLVTLNAEQTAEVELREQIKQASDVRTAAKRKLMRQARNKVTAAEKLAEEKTPRVHFGAEVQKARAHAEEMAKVPNFGENLLSKECRDLLSTAAAKNLLEAAEAEEAQEPEYDLVDEDKETRDENDVPKIVPAPFTDIDELKVLDVDLVQTKKEWMARLIEPLIIDEFYKKLAEEHDGKFPCLLCRELPDELKPITFVGKKKGQDTFESRAKLNRHEELVHTPWFDLMQYMITDDPEAFKCPSTDCSFRADTIEDVREHCVKDCEERELYEDMKRKHALAQGKKSKGTDARADLQLAKQNRQLRGHGLQIEDKVIQGIENIATTSTEEMLELAAKRQVQESDVRPHLHGLVTLNERLRMSIDEDGLVKDPYAEMPMEEISKSLLTPDIDADINARITRKR